MEKSPARKVVLLEALALHSSETTVTILAQILANVFFITNYPPSWLPYYYLAQIVVTTPLILLFKPVFESNRRNLFFIQALFILLVPGIWMFSSLHWYWFPLICSLYVAVLGNFYGLACWHCVSKAFNVRQLKEINNTVMLVSTFFGSLVSVSLGFFKDFISLNALVGVMLFFMVAGGVFTYILPHIEIHTRRAIQSKTIFRYPLFQQLFIYSTLISFVYVVSDYALKYQLAIHFNEHKAAKFLLYYYAATNVLCLISVTISRKFIQYISITMVLSVLPVYYLITSFGLLVQANLMTVTIFSAGYGIFYYSTNVIGREYALNALPERVSSKGRLYTKALAKSLGMLIGMGALWFFRKTPNFTIIAALSIAISFLCLYLLRGMLKAYLSALQLAITLKRFDILDLEASEALTNNVNYKSILAKVDLNDPNAVKFSLFLIRQLKLSKIPPEILSLVESPIPKVRVSVVRYILWFNDSSYLPALYRMIDHENDEKVIRVLLHTIARLHGKRAKHLIKRYLHSSNPKIRSGAIHLAIDSGNLEEVEGAIQELRTMINHEDKSERKEAARLLGGISIGVLTEELKQLINDKEKDVAISAVKSTVERKNPVYIPLLIMALEKHHVAYYSSRALIGYGSKALLPLERAIGAYGALVDSKIIAIIARIDDPKVEDILKKITRRKQNYYHNIIARESALRACRLAISNNFKQFVMKEIERESYIIKHYRYVLNMNIPNYLKAEVISRNFFATQRLVHWIAVLSNQPAAILELLPFISREEKIHQADLFRDQAIVLLTGYLHNRRLNRVVNECLVPQEENGEIPTTNLDILKEDEWLQEVYRYYCIKELGQNAEGMNMILMDKVFTLRATTLFAKLTGEVLMAIAEQVEARSISKDEVIFTQGDIGDGLYIIDSGKVLLHRKEIVLKEFLRGDSFGELSLIDAAPRAATAKVLEDGAVLFIGKETFEEITYSFPEVLWALTETVLEYLRVEQQRER